jgi:hypothetical protein
MLPQHTQSQFDSQVARQERAATMKSFVSEHASRSTYICGTLSLSQSSKSAANHTQQSLSALALFYGDTTRVSSRRRRRRSTLSPSSTRHQRC